MSAGRLRGGVAVEVTRVRLVLDGDAADTCSGDFAKDEGGELALLCTAGLSLLLL